MTDSTARPDPERKRQLRSVYEPSSLDSVADAVAVATEHERRIYVERIGDAWRWSPTNPGGMYPLLRITASFLRVDYHSLVIGFRRITDDVFILAGDPATDRDPDAWMVIEFEGPTEASKVRERIERSHTKRPSSQ